VNRTIHQANERIPIAELEALTRIYRRTLDLYFGRSRT
jgi:acetylornithine deacetylase/succinyl-diaminopimelate desuccinylase-like protein